jgi:cytosine/adenosine deaminase-related metal-dependent hydrolase
VADRLLIRTGTVLDTEPEPLVHKETDVLIEDGTIVAVGKGLPTEGAEIIDATGRIVLPGFVDTHRHVWQATLRSTTVDVDLGAYLDLVIRKLSRRLRPEDVYTGTLAGALECLDAGITTVQDFAAVQYSPEHSDASIAGLRDAGIRAVYGHGYAPFDPNTRQPQEVRRIREQYFPSGNGILTMAFAAAGPAYAPIDTVEEDWRLADELGLPIAVHIGSGPVAELPVDTLRERGLLRDNTLYVHGNTLPDKELRLIAESGGAVSIAPAVEAQMGHGKPMVGRLKAAGVTTGLGVDVVTAAPGDPFSLMRATLLSSHLDDQPRITAAEVLRMATLDGATALGLGEAIGSLRPGKQADLVLLRADALNLVGAGHDPIGAVVTAAQPGNVDTVLVAGRVVKRDGRLRHADLRHVVDAVRASAEYLVSA